MTGEKLWRIRESGPIPGKNANRVGEELTPKRKRFDCCTHWPLVFRFRIMNGWPAAELAMPTTGWNFQDPRNSTGRLMPVSQSRVLRKSPGKIRLMVRESLGLAVVSSGTRTLST